jgi:hypothetical protein
MLVNARLSYISVDGLHYSFYSQVILTVNLDSCFTFDRLRVTLSNRDRTRPYKTFIITIITLVGQVAIFH